MNEKKTIQNIIEILSEKQGMDKKDAELFVKGMFDLIEEALATEKYVKVKGLGTFKLTEVDSRASVDVNTGERIEIQGHTKISFTPDSTLKELINKPFSHFETVVLDDEANEGEPADEMKDLETTTDTVSVEVGDEMKEVEEAPEESPIPVSAEEPERVEEALESIEEVVAEEEKEETIVTPATDEETISEKVAEEVEAEVTNVEMEEPKLEETPSVAPKKKGNSTLWIVLLALLLLIAFGLYWIFRSPSQEETQPTPVKVESIVEETPAIVEEPDSSSTLTIEEPAPAISASNEKVATIADTTEYKIVGNKTSYTVQSGETLTKIALKFYGSKNYWPYIAIHNKGTLKNTNQLSVGVKLEIPELKPINE